MILVWLALAASVALTFVAFVLLPWLERRTR